MEAKPSTQVLVFFLFTVVILTRDIECYTWPRRNTYMTRWDKVNLDEILQNKRLLHHYFRCLMGVGPCPPDGQELKRVLPEALETACAKCSKSQKEGAIYVIKYLREYMPKKLEMLANRYDPDGKYRRRYYHSTSVDNNTT
ncbi:ejaculatory bulb-specific protein 3 [Diachasma alloeum]|uniref:Chemosensory protein 8 n=1 Tax=Diachasma alloeum TaxID=454923 RepID=A0A4E0RQQ6_9HYME|nr:ejaculatory bulb-specific protein 3 [Diachasma alloeum]THK33134.1 chemosensory protein 8 [Diachasma alloeum]